MKNKFRIVAYAILCVAALQLGACKGKKTSAQTSADSSVKDTTAMAPKPAPVVVSPDSALKANVKDATKDFPGVNAMVDSGKVTLTGNIKRDKLPKLMMSVSALHPKKIINNLTIGK